MVSSKLYAPAALSTCYMPLVPIV